jgi:hypothetical protein
MGKKMKEIQIKEKEKAHGIEEMKRKIAQQSGKINQLRRSNNRLAADCDEKIEKIGFRKKIGRSTKSSEASRRSSS